MPRSSDGSPAPASTRSSKKRYNDHVIDAVVFDWDGTLMDDDASWKRCVAATAAEVACRHPLIDAAELTAAYYAAGERVWNEIRDTMAPPWGNMDDRGIVQRVWSGALQGTPASADASVLAAETWTGLTLRAIFNHALATLNAAPSRSVYVGDSPARDVAGAGRHATGRRRHKPGISLGYCPALSQNSSNSRSVSRTSVTLPARNAWPTRS